jgi:hypothetical protein
VLSCTPDTLNPKPSSLDLKRHRRNRQIEGILHQRYSRPVLTLRLNGALSGAHGNGEHIHFLQCLDHRLSRHLNHFFQFPVQVMQSTDQGFIRYSCRANLARIRQSRPDSESGLALSHLGHKFCEPLKFVPSRSATLTVPVHILPGSVSCMGDGLHLFFFNHYDLLRSIEVRAGPGA